MIDILGTFVNILGIFAVLSILWVVYQIRNRGK